MCHFGPLLIRAVLKEPKYFLFKAALKDHPSEHPTTDDLTRAILVPFDGDPQECRGYVAHPPSCGPLRRQAEVATFDFVPFDGVGVT